MRIAPRHCALLVQRGHLREGRAWLAQALARRPTCTRGYALLSADQLAHNQGDNADLHVLAQAEQMFVQLADVRSRSCGAQQSWPGLL